MPKIILFWPALLHVQSDGEIRKMLDPELFESPAAAEGGAAKAGSNSSSSAAPSYSSGLVQDSVTMLGMLAGINALVEGALPLAVQVYACKVSGKPLPLPAKQGAEFREKDVAAALQDWDRVNLLELRAFLLQVRQQLPKLSFVGVTVWGICNHASRWGHAEAHSGSVDTVASGVSCWGVAGAGCATKTTAGACYVSQGLCKRRGCFSLGHLCVAAFQQEYCLRARLVCLVNLP